MKYWEDQGVLTRKNTGYLIANLQEKELHQLYKPKVALSADQIQKSAESQKKAKTIEYINNRYFSGLMPTTFFVRSKPMLILAGASNSAIASLLKMIPACDTDILANPVVSIE